MSRATSPRIDLRGNAAARRRPLIGLTPLIDVVFILLIFLMLASSFLEWRTIPLAAPVRAGGSADTGAILVRLAKSGGLDVNGAPARLDELSRAVAARQGREPAQRVVVQPDGGVPLQRVVSVLDVLAAAGIRDISLVRRGGETK